MIWKIFKIILKNTIQMKNEKFWLYPMIWLLICLVIKKLYPIVTELFIRGRRLNIYLVFVTRSYFAVPKNIRLNSRHFFAMKAPNKRDLQQIVFNHSSDIDFQDFRKLFEKCTAKPYSFFGYWYYSCIR